MTAVKAASIVLALDPSLTSTGFVVIDGRTETILSAGAIRPKELKEWSRLLSAEVAARRAAVIFDTVQQMVHAWHPRAVLLEANGGSKSMKAAVALHRAQQAVVDAVRTTTGGWPIWTSPQAVKKSATGRNDGSKEDVEAAMRRRWKWAPDAWERLPEGVHTVAGTKAEADAYDAAAVASALWSSPVVAAILSL